MTEFDNYDLPDEIEPIDTNEPLVEEIASPAVLPVRSRPMIEPDIDESPLDEGGYRGGAGDPAFGFLLAIAVSVGLIPVLPANADLRYTLAWGALALVGVIAWLLGNADRVGQETPENIAWGAAFGLIVSVPFLIFFADTFERAAHQIFPLFGAGSMLAYLLFVMPLAETLFFRGLLQRRLEFWIVGGLGGIWSIVLFFPVMWEQILGAPAVAVFLAIALFAMQMMYSYVRERNGLAASWISQIVANIILIFIPFISR